MQLRIVENFKVYFKNNSFVNYIKDKNIDFDVFWFRKHRPDNLFFNKREIIINEITCFIIGLINIRGFRNKKVVCFGGHYSLLLITRLVGPYLGKEYHLYIYNFFLHKLGKKKVIRRIMHFLLNTKYSTVIVQSPLELDYYRSLSKNNVYFIPYCEDPDFAMGKSQIPDSRYLFTGGYSNRDYDLIMECALLNPAITFLVVASKLNKEIKRDKLPNNFTLFEDVDILTFNALMHKSFGVIVPLKEDVGASGQMLCLGAMKMSKPIIYCDISSINYYFADSSFGIPYSLGDINSLIDAVQKLYSGNYDNEDLGKKAYSHYLKSFTLNKRNELLLDLILSR